MDSSAPSEQQSTSTFLAVFHSTTTTYYIQSYPANMPLQLRLISITQFSTISHHRRHHPGM